MGWPQAHEHAALLTMLRSQSGRTWPQIAAEVAFSGSAVDLWRSQAGDSLLPDLDEEAAFAAARAELASWQQGGLRMVTILDEDYPRRLLDIRETPPILSLSSPEWQIRGVRV